MTFKNRVGTFLLLAGGLSLFVFITSLVAPELGYNLPALAVGVVLFGLGWQWRRAKGGRPAPVRPAGTPLSPGPPAAPKAAPNAPAKKRGPLDTLLHGPQSKKPALPPPARPQPPPPKTGMAKLLNRKK